MTKPHYDQEYVRDISVEVYKIRLRADYAGKPDNVERMLAKDNDGGVKLRRRAEAYDSLTRSYLEALSITP